MKKDDPRKRLIDRLTELGRPIEPDTVDAYLVTSERLLVLYRKERHARGKTRMSYTRAIAPLVTEQRRLLKRLFGTDHQMDQAAAADPEVEDARWKRKLECDEAWRRISRNGLTGPALAMAEATREEYGDPSWQALMFRTEAEAEADLAELA